MNVREAFPRRGAHVGAPPNPTLAPRRWRLHPPQRGAEPPPGLWGLPNQRGWGYYNTKHKNTKTKTQNTTKNHTNRTT